MIHTPENSKGKVLVDAHYNVIMGVKSFDDTTNVAEIILMTTLPSGKSRPVIVNNPGVGMEMVTMRVVLNGAKVVDQGEAV